MHAEKATKTETGRASSGSDDERDLERASAWIEGERRRLDLERLGIEAGTVPEASRAKVKADEANLRAVETKVATLRERVQAESSARARYLKPEGR